MTGDYSKQLRAIFLAFVMVTSIAMAGVAFSGSAAAEEVTTSANSDDLNSAYDAIGNTGDDEADTIVVDGDIDSSTALDIDGTDDLTITNADGTSPTIDLTDATGSDAIQINSDVNVTIEGVTIQADQDSNVINANGLSEDSTLSVVDSTLDVDSSGTNAFGIRTDATNAGEGGTVDVQNVTFEDTSGQDHEEAGIFAYKATEVSVTDSTFDGLDFGIQTPDVPTVTVQDSSFTALQDEGIILNNENGDSYAPAVTITGNEFGTINGGGSASTAVLFLEDTGSGYWDDSNGIQVTNNNFNDSTGYAIATTTGFTANQGSNDDQAVLGITIDATDNFYNSDLGPVVEDETGTETRSIPTEYANDGNAAHIVGVNADFRPFRVGPAPDGTSVDFDFDNSISQDSADERTVTNVTFAGNVNESSIQVYAVNDDTNGNNETLVEDGAVVADDSDVIESTLDGANDGYEFVSINSSVQEGTDVELDARAKDQSGNDIFASTQQEVAAASVAMGGRSLRLDTDPSGPEADTEGDDTGTGNGEVAEIAVTAVDRFGNDKTRDQNNGNIDTDVNADPADISITSSDSANISDGSTNAGQVLADTINSLEGTDDALINTSSSRADNTVVDLGYANAGEVDITATDTGETNSFSLGSTTATQRYTAVVDRVDVSVDSDTLPADGSSTLNITVQAVDAQGNPVNKSDVTADLSLNNASSSAANIGTDSVNDKSGAGSYTDQLTTFQNGTASVAVTAQNQGYIVGITAVGGGGSDDASFETVSGDIDATQSSLSVAGNTADFGSVKVNTEHRVLVDLQDTQNNPVSSRDVELSSNVSGTSFASSTLTTNASGQAETTVTLPEEKGTAAIDASAGDFNATGSPDTAQVNVTTVAENISTLAFASDAPASIAPNSENNGVNIEANDMFGNLNETDSGTVTLESSDASVVDFDGAASSDQAFSGGVANFNVDANGTGTATLTATIPDENVTNVSQDITVANPDSIQLTPAHNVVSSDVSQGANQAELGAQFVDANGDALGINNENITFARQSGSAAELDQSRTDFTEKTDGDGNVTINVNGTSSTGETTFIALSENFSVQGSTTVTTTGGADSISVFPENSSVAVNETVNVTASFVDTEGRNVPRVGTGIQLSTGGNGTVDDGSVSTALVDGDVIAEFTYNATDATAGEDATLTALGDGVTGTATISVTGDAGAPGEFDPVTEYGNEQGEVDTDGLLGGIGDYRTGDLTVEQLLEVIGEWRASR